MQVSQRQYFNENQLCLQRLAFIFNSAGWFFIQFFVLFFLMYLRIESIIFHVCISVTSDLTANVAFFLLLIRQTCLSVLSSVGVLFESPFEISSASDVLNTNFQYRDMYLFVLCIHLFTAESVNTGDQKISCFWGKYRVHDNNCIVRP